MYNIKVFKDYINNHAMQLLFTLLFCTVIYAHVITRVISLENHQDNATSSSNIMKALYFFLEACDDLHGTF